MQTSRRDIFATIRTEGGIIPADLLVRIAEGDAALEGLTPDAYHLARSERLNEAANRAWNRLQGAWESFRPAMDKLPESDAGTSLTRERWLLILFQELGYGRLPAAKAAEIEGRTYPISHTWQATPIHLVSFRQELDRRTPGARGASRVSPHSLVQEFLNRSEGCLWGFAANGLKLRLLRDNRSLTRASYVEFDLAAMMDGEAYSDFALLYLLCHQSRVEVPEGKTPEHCWLEKWHNAAAQAGTRVLENLRQGVEQAIETLGGGFLAHPANAALREKLRNGQLTTLGYYRQVLRTVYRLLFLFVAEDRDLLLVPHGDDQAIVKARQLYTQYYSTQRLRRLAARRRGTRHPDQFRALKLVFEKLRSGCSELALPPLGSLLFSAKAAPDLDSADIANSDFLRALWHLTVTVDGNVRRAVDYRNLGPEELGSVYVSLLEMHPEVNIDAAVFALNVAAGSERKTTGSYYTPTSLVNCLLDSALEPVLAEACKKPDPEKALLALKICDTSCGSGHILIAAAHRVAKRLAAVRAGEDEPSPEAIRHALRDVIGRCIYGVDINPDAVELCKISLWLEALEPGKPLTFLDHHIQCGNSLLGATPALIADGIPDDAFVPIEGDDKGICSALKKENKTERKGQRRLYGAMPSIKLGNLVQTFANLRIEDDSTPQAAAAKEQHYYELVRSAPYENACLLADAWCAAFVWPKNRQNQSAITEASFRRWEDNPHSMTPAERQMVVSLRQQYRFFHWHLAFPDVFRVPAEGETPENEQSGWSGGFDVVLGNPPWERIKLQEKEFFAVRDPQVADAPNAAARKRLIEHLRELNPALYRAFKDALRKADGESYLVRNSGRYPLCGRGDVNTYAIFAELKRGLLNGQGSVGCVVPSGIATDDTTKFFFQSLMETGSLVSLYSFENEEFIFPDIHHATKFCLLTMAGSTPKSGRKADFVFFARQVSELAEEERHFGLSPSDLALLNPNTRTCPIFRAKRDAELTLAIHRRIPVLVKEADGTRREENPWGIGFSRMIDMANDSGLFRTRVQLEAEGFALKDNVFRRGSEVYLPLYEGKMFWHFDHRFGTYDGQTEAQANQGKLPELDDAQHGQPLLLSEPWYWVVEPEVRARIPRRPEMLASALDLPEEWRRDAVQKTFCYWAAGFYRKAGDEKRAARLLEAASPAHHTDTQFDVLNRWLLDARCELMQDRFPVTQTDVERMVAFLENPVPLAEELVERFSPHWFMAFRDVTSAVVLRTAVFSVLPRAAVGHTAPLVFLENPRAADVACLLAALNSFALDYCARQSVGGSHLTYSYLRQFPVLPPETFLMTCPWDARRSLERWVASRAIELSYTAWDLEPLGADCGYNGPPFQWSEDRRFAVRCELDAAFFHLYLGTPDEWKENGTAELLHYFPTPRNVVDYVMDTFRILKERDEAAHGEYRTKKRILAIYDALAEVMAANAAAVAAGRKPTVAYQSALNPPPGPLADAQGNFLPLPAWTAGAPRPADWPVHIHAPRHVTAARPAVPAAPVVVAAHNTIDPTFPTTAIELTACAAAIDLVIGAQEQKLPSTHHLDAYLLLLQPDWCEALLPKPDRPKFRKTAASVWKASKADDRLTVRWADVRAHLTHDHVAALRLLDIHGMRVLAPGDRIRQVRTALPGDYSALVPYALRAAERWQEIVADASKAGDVPPALLKNMTAIRDKQAA